MKCLEIQSFFQLPIAPKQISRIRFEPLSRKKEQCLLPSEALGLFATWLKEGRNADAVLLHGIGDPLASMEETLQCIEGIRALSDIPIYIRTLGINGEKYADRLMQAGLTGIELLVDGIDTSTLEKIYAWIRPGFKTIKLDLAAKILLEEQKKSIIAFKDTGCRVDILATSYGEENVSQMPRIAQFAQKLGVDGMAVQIYKCLENQDVALQETSPEMLEKICSSLEKHITTYPPRSLCNPVQQEEPAIQYKASKEQPYIAIASSNGMDIDTHLGQASTFLIYGQREDGLTCLIESRPAPAKGGGAERWKELAARLADCFLLCVSAAGSTPRELLATSGTPVFISDAQITSIVEHYFQLGKKGKCKK